MKVTVIMASYLSPYPGSASNPEKKFLRAVNSFKSQTYEDKELIIVSDGCQKTVELYEKYFLNDENIHLLPIQKQPLYSGEMRNVALRQANGDIICYLDADDIIGKKHIQTIIEQFTEDVDWVYYNDYLVKSADFKQQHVRLVEPRYASIGTSSIAHRNFYSERYKKDISKPTWKVGYGHDWLYVLKMCSFGYKFKKLNIAPQYLVCHYGGGDF